MAKAHITTEQGTKITIEGTPEEVAILVSQLKYTGAQTGRRDNRKGVGRVPSNPRYKVTPVNLVSNLIDGGFFKKPKDLATVKVAIEELGHVYPVTTLSPVLLRLVRKRQLRRLKEKKKWVYTG